VTFIGIKWYELHYYYYVKHNPFDCDGVVHTDCSLFLREGKPRGRTLKCDFHFFLWDKNSALKRMKQPHHFCTEKNETTTSSSSSYNLPMPPSWCSSFNSWYICRPGNQNYRGHLANGLCDGRWICKDEAICLFSLYKFKFEWRSVLHRSQNVRTEINE
jgi:hypothetical protein